MRRWPILLKVYARMQSPMKQHQTRHTRESAVNLINLTTVLSELFDIFAEVNAAEKQHMHMRMHVPYDYKSTICTLFSIGRHLLHLITQLQIKNLRSFIAPVLLLIILICSSFSSIFLHHNMKSHWELFFIALDV